MTRQVGRLTVTVEPDPEQPHLLRLSIVQSRGEGPVSIHESLSDIEALRLARRLEDAVLDHRTMSRQDRGQA